MLPLRGIRPKNACSRLEKDGNDEEEEEEEEEDDDDDLFLLT